MAPVFLIVLNMRENGVIINERGNEKGAVVYGCTLEGKLAWRNVWQLQAGFTVQQARYKAVSYTHLRIKNGSTALYTDSLFYFLHPHIIPVAIVTEVGIRVLSRNMTDSQFHTTHKLI